MHFSMPPPHTRLRALQGLALACALLLGGCSTTPPYRPAPTPDTGFDCSGLIGYVYRLRVGTPPPRTVAQLSDWGQAVDVDELRTGDLVVFGRGRNPSHAGIYVGEGRFVHAPSSGGTVRLDELQSRHWSRQNPAFRRP